ncbi:MAG TPA: hypothetical protein VN655_07100 [Pseudolabrys sp.]|nr:hypothetical protein [Pseudolabrys sp.]
MVELPKDRLLDLRAKVKQQRTTVEALKRDGHEFTDAERHLRELQSELRIIEASSSRAPPDVPGSSATSS